MVSPFVQPNAARACSNAALRATVSTSPGASAPTTTMRRFAPDRCARAAIGQAAAPPIKVTNSRRLIGQLRGNPEQGLVLRGFDRKGWITSAGPEDGSLPGFGPGYVGGWSIA